jgi:hypothetical protein
MALASICLPLFTIRTLILIEGACIFQIISGVTLGDLTNWIFPMELEVQRVNTTLSDDAAGECSKKTYPW